MPWEEGWDGLGQAAREGLFAGSRIREQHVWQAGSLDRAGIVQTK